MCEKFNRPCVESTTHRYLSTTEQTMMRSLLVALALLQVTLGAEIRGLNPNKKPSYNPTKDFTCLDGSATIPFSLVNDDYCDCR